MNTERYNTPILELVQIINSANVSQINKGEFFGYFLDHLVHRYIQIPEGKGDQFNAHLFPASIRKSLDLMVQRLAALISTSDPMEMSTDLNYVITQAMDGFASPGITPGMKLFLKGCICKTMTKVQEPSDGTLGNDPGDRVMASRRRVIALGVLSDLLNHPFTYPPGLA